MPELPEVETVRRGLMPVFEGARLANVEARRADLRFPFPERFVKRLEGRLVTSLRRRAKYLLADLDSGETLVMHLGMSGSFRIEQLLLPLAGEGGAQRRMRGRQRQEPSEVPVTDPVVQVRPTPHPPFGDPPGNAIAFPSVPQGEKENIPGQFVYPRSKNSAHDHVVFHFQSGARVIYNDPRRFGFMTLVETTKLEAHPLFDGLGVEPLGDEFDVAHLAALLKDVKAPLKSALLDQRRIAGLGNIYVCEALHRAQLSPLKPAGAAPKPKIKALHRAIRAVLEEAVEAGGSTLRDHRQADGELGYFQHSFKVYDREGQACRNRGCGGLICGSCKPDARPFIARRVRCRNCHPRESGDPA